MTEIFSIPAELSNSPEVIAPAELEEVLRRARTPIIKEGFAEPWAEDPVAFDPAQAGWEQAAGKVLAKIQEMQSSGLVQLTPEGLTPKQVAAKAGESAKLAKANARAAKLAEQLRQAAAATPPPEEPITLEAPPVSPLEQWNQLSDDQRNADLGEWYRRLQAGEPIEDWQRKALKDFNVWGGDGPLPPAETAEPGLGGPTRESRRQLSDWLSKVDWKRVALEGVEILGPAIFSAGLYEAFPQLRNGMVAVASTAFGLGALTEAAAGGILMAEKRFPRLARLAKLAGYVRGKGYLTMQLSASALAGMAVTGIVHHFQLQAATEAAGAGVGETGYQAGPSPDVAEEIARRSGEAGAATYPQSPDVAELRGESPVPPVEQAPVLSDEAREFAEAQEQAAAEAAANQAAEAARQAALQLGPTVAELAAKMPKQTVSEAIYQMIGDVPHRGEVTNILFRAIGDKVNNLNEGAIKAAVDALRPVFDNIDKVMTDSGTAYTEGGRAVVEAMSGFNSPEAQAIRAANMGDLEAAGNLLNNVIGPVIK